MLTETTSHRMTAVTLRPRFEGANIRTWIGFKHFMYLVEEAVLQWFREHESGPQRLYHEYGLGLSLVDSSVQLPAVLELDDVVDAVVSGGPGRFTVRLSALRERAPTVLRGTLTVALVRELELPAPTPVPAALAPLVVSELAAASIGPRSDRTIRPGTQPATALIPAGSGAFLWSWRAPYYYCQFSDRVQHSGYVRALEEVVDRFLTDRGLSVRTMLVERGWIPVVSRARVSLLADTYMEETVHTVFTVTSVLKGIMFDAQMDCYVHRDRTLVHTATGRILHGYAIAHGPDAGNLAELDTTTITALTGTTSP